VLREVGRSESYNLLTAINEILTSIVYNFRRIWTTGLFGTEEDNETIELNLMYYCHRVSTQLQLTNISYRISLQSGYGCFPYKYHSNLYKR